MSIASNTEYPDTCKPSVTSAEGNTTGPVGFYSQMRLSHWSPVYRAFASEFSLRLNLATQRLTKGLLDDGWFFSELEFLGPHESMAVRTPGLTELLLDLQVSPVCQTTGRNCSPGGCAKFCSSPQKTVLLASSAAPTNALLLHPMLELGDSHSNGFYNLGMPPPVSLVLVDSLLVQDYAKTRFICPRCAREWTSMRGAITFLVAICHVADMILNLNLKWRLKPGANVFFELYPQLCQRCNELCAPKWYPEEIKKVINNMFVTVHKTYYNQIIEWNYTLDTSRRLGNPNGPHDSANCLACAQGTCQGMSRKNPGLLLPMQAIEK